VLDGETGELTQKPEMTVARTGPGIVRWASKVLIFGGHQGSPPGIPDSEAFALQDNEWNVIPPLPEPSACNNAVSFDDMIYITGKDIVDVLRYNPDTMSYVPLEVPLGKGCNSVFVAEGQLYILNKDE